MLSDYIGYWPSMVAMVVFVVGAGIILYKLNKKKWPWERK